MKITYLNGIRFSRAIKAATLWLSKEQQQLNDINVYPVPDSDTGTNMAATMNSVAESVDVKKNESIEKVTESIAESALNGARGNSGAILAQFFYGFAEGLRGKFKITTQHFSEAVHRAVERSYEALANPREGTILTVIKDWGEHVKEMSKKTRDFSEVMHSSLQVAHKSLEETPKKLKQLAKAGVVDAGALGFVYMLEGITDFISNGKIRDIDSTQLNDSIPGNKVADITFSLEDIKFRFCTEFFLSGQNIPTSLLRKELQNFGDSLIVAGSNTRVRVHIHTNNPREVFDFVSQYGQILEQKVDDMHQQHTDAYANTEKRTIALVTDSSCDLPDELIRKYNIHLVPLRVMLDGTEYIDKVTIMPEEVYSRLTQAKSFPQTSQPSPKDFLRLYQQLTRRYKTIISVHLSSGLSGTYQSALVAAKQIPDCDIRVIDSRNLSTTLGLILREAGDALARDMKASELVELIQKWSNQGNIFAGVRTVDYLIKGGRLSKARGFLAKLMRLVPILTLDEDGKAKKIGVAKPGLALQKKLLNFVLRKAEQMKNPVFAIVHVEAPETADWYYQQLQALFGERVFTVMPVSPVLGAHVGPGAAAISILDTQI